MSRSAPKSNIALLTEGQGYIQRAKKARREQIEEIKFDDEARREWLGGFHKRKKAKTEDRRSRAKERDRQAHVEERRKARQELKERAAQNVKSMREAMGLPAFDEGGSEDEDEDDERLQDLESEYEDDDQLATVTITEDFDPSEQSQPVASSSRTPPSVDRIPVPQMPASGRRAGQKEKREKEKAAEKERREEKKGRSMETKAERKMGRALEARKRTKKAGIAMERDGRSRGRDAKGGKRKGVKDGRGVKGKSGGVRKGKR